MKITLSVILALVLMSFSLNGWKTLDTSVFSLKYPDEWQLDESGSHGTRLIIFKPGSSPSGFRSSVNLIVQELKGTGVETLKQYVEVSESQLGQYISGAKVLFSETKDDRHTIVYTGTNGALEFKWKQYYWVRNEKAYVLTFTSEEKNYSSDISTVDEIMNSFQLK